jgi:hypothetical protein
MKPMSQFEPSNPVSRTMMQLTGLIADLRQVARDLEISIEHEEKRAFLFVARHLRDRRDRLLLTISTLESHLNEPVG